MGYKIILSQNNRRLSDSDTDHMIVGSVTGVGAARGRKAVRWKVGQKMVAAWIMTLPGAALVSCVFYKLITFFIG